jgi:hypothetical protein
MSDTYETVDGSKIIPANDIAKYAEQLKRERDQWRECAEKLAEELKFERDCMPKSMRGPQIAMAHFNRLKEETK